MLRYEIRDGIVVQVRRSAVHAFAYFKEDLSMRAELDAFIEHSKGKEVFFDIGALYGIFSITFLKHNTTSKAIAFEPSPLCKPYLLAHKKYNKLVNWTLAYKAVGNENKKVQMHFDWHHLIINSHNTIVEHGQNVAIEMTTIDSYVAHTTTVPDIMKIDVEGFEYQVLQGAMDTLITHHPTIFLELHGNWIQQFGHTHLDVINLLLSLNYRITFLNHQKVDITDPQLGEVGCRLIATHEKKN